MVVLVSFALFSTIYGDLKFCREEMKLDGQCDGPHPGYDCAMEFLGKYGAGSMPQHCTCQNITNSQRICACDIVCRSQNNLISYEDQSKRQININNNNN
ncbi:hypothetical protein PIB30_041839 [Stylosanthes scabra]|uniref:Uncharacterized protein n=1 Tax=Stylosanthes scabra TaxID=79078 RepID=A0ABU6RF51_9FABA|nr:hypothetical protein [Stylosanthes scabra]